MATSKTLKPTNQTASIPAMSDRPNQATNSDTMGKTIDAVNALYDKTNIVSYASKINVATFLSNLATLISSMNSTDFRVVRFHANDTSSPFVQNYMYAGLLVKLSENYQSILLMNPEANTLIYGRCGTGTWTWRTLTTNAPT